jgi:8-oxo-dGTP pyrophosphatase MutT (NUDIX family)
MDNNLYDYVVSFLIYEMSVDQNGHQFTITDRLIVDAGRDEMLQMGGFDGYVQLAAEGLRSRMTKPGMKAAVDMVTIRDQMVYLSSSDERHGFVMHSQMKEILSSLAKAFRDDGHFEVVGKEIRRTDRPAIVERYENPPTVAVLLVETKSGLVVIRRGLKDGFGKLALPGGFHVKGETWQEAAAREVLEETGLALNPSKISIRDLVTVGGGTINLAFGQYTEIADDFEPKFDSEVLDVKWINSPVESAFATHTAMIKAFFDEKLSN